MQVGCMSIAGETEVKKVSGFVGGNYRDTTVDYHLRRRFENAALFAILLQ
jgi:hypothetical protein